MTTATIQKIVSISPTVKFMKVLVENKEFSFKPGQWVDFIVPGLSAVGGFSMCSPPSLLKKENILHLAVKYSTHPPAHWVHNSCMDGIQVTLQCGGDISYEMKPETLGDNLLLIGAGVGINPILSIMKQVYNVHQTNMNFASIFGKISLFYTATSYEELIFKEDISLIEANDKTFTSHYFVTRPPSECLPQHITLRRMDQEDIQKGIDEMGVSPQKIISYMCAPQPMMHEMDSMLKRMGLLKENIRYESWW